jgi:hypothetical protein
MTEPPGVPPTGGQPPRYPAPNFPAPTPQSPTYPATSSPGGEAAPPEPGDDLFQPAQPPPATSAYAAGLSAPTYADQYGDYADQYGDEAEASGRRRAAHGADRGPGSGLLPVLLILLAAAAVAVAVVVVTRAINHKSTPVAATPTSTSAASVTPSNSPSASPSTTPSDSASPTASPSPTKTHHSPSPSPSKTANPVATAPKIPVTVFNQTTVPGAAAALAATLRADGWPIAGVDNWRGFVPATTVYYWPGDADSALRLARESDVINRVRPATPPMPTGSLVVIIAN